MGEQILSAPWIHQRVIPRQHEHASRRLGVLNVDHGQSGGRLPARIDDGAQLGLEQSMEVGRRAGDLMAHWGRRRGTTCSDDPAQLAPRKRSLQARRWPGTDRQEAIEGLADSDGIEGTVAMDDQARIVTRTGATPLLVLRHEDEVGAANRKAAKGTAGDC